MKPGDTWKGRDGTVYRVVAANDVGNRPRWWIHRDIAWNFEHAHECKIWLLGPATPDCLHVEPRRAGGDLALVYEESPSPMLEESPATPSTAVLRTPEEVRAWIKRLPKRGGDKS